MNQIHEIGDNIRVEFRGRRRENFDRIMDVVFTLQNKAVAYAITNNELILYWAEDDKATKLPYVMNVEQTKTFVWGWLETRWNSPKDFMDERPDHDGDNENGFHIHTGDMWGHINGKWEAFVAIKPEWILLGK